MAEKENISALLDGEAVDKQLISEMLRDQDAADTWKSYNAISDVMRGDAPQSLNWDIANSVAAALDKEPAHFPQNHETVTDFREAQPTPAQVKRFMPGWLQHLTQVGMAACVSLAVIVGVQQYNGGENTDPAIQATQPPVLETIPFSGAAEPVSLNRDNLRSNPTEAQVMEQRRRINAMLQDYELQLRLNADTLPADDEWSPSTMSVKDR